MTWGSGIATVWNIDRRLATPHWRSSATQNPNYPGTPDCTQLALPCFERFSIIFNFDLYFVYKTSTNWIILIFRNVCWSEWRRCLLADWLIDLQRGSRKTIKCPGWSPSSTCAPSETRDPVSNGTAISQSAVVLVFCARGFLARTGLIGVGAPVKTRSGLSPSLNLMYTNWWPRCFHETARNQSTSFLFEIF